MPHMENFEHSYSSLQHINLQLTGKLRQLIGVQVTFYNIQLLIICSFGTEYSFLLSLHITVYIIGLLALALLKSSLDINLENLLILFLFLQKLDLMNLLSPPRLILKFKKGEVYYRCLLQVTRIQEGRSGNYESSTQEVFVRNTKRALCQKTLVLIKSYKDQLKCL